MDAKPQRPLRTLRVQRDENAAIVNPAGKTLHHHRNKSTPALSNADPTTTTGLANALSKRTAFGDVSNTALARASKDDTSAASKVALKPQDKRPVNLARPAQRPSSGTVKPSLTTSASLNNLNRPSGVVDRAQINTRNPPARRNTVFRDPALQPVPESSQPGQWQQHASTQEQEPQQHGSIEQNAPVASVLPEEKDVSVRENQYPEREPIVSHITNGASVPERHEELLDNVKNGGAEESTVSRTAQDPVPGISNPALEVIPESADMHSPETGYDYAQAVSDPPEEYWDEEEEEAYDEEGYTTARSHPSRGDNTTGGATVTLCPKYTHDVKREISFAKSVVEASQTIEDYEDECGDTSMVAEYGTEIFQYMRDLERRLLPNPHYMDNQAEIQWSMRSVLMDWLVQVHLRFSLLPETLFLCVNYIDRFLSRKIVSLGKLQLVGATAIFIAAKYEEINCPSVHEIVYMVDNGYDADEILKAERFMLSMLQFELGWPGPMSFLRRISKADDYDLETRTLAKYFLEITVMDERFVGSPPSFLAAGAHCLARLMLRKGSWTQAHVYYSNYTYSQLHPLVCLILECCDVPQKHHAAVYEKYSDKRFKRASFFVEGEVARGFLVPDVPRDGRSSSSRSSLLDNNRLSIKAY